MYTTSFFKNLVYNNLLNTELLFKVANYCTKETQLCFLRTADQFQRQFPILSTSTFGDTLPECENKILHGEEVEVGMGTIHIRSDNWHFLNILALSVTAFYLALTNPPILSDRNSNKILAAVMLCGLTLFCQYKSLKLHKNGEHEISNLKTCLDLARKM